MSPSPRQLWQQLARSSWLFFPFTSASPPDKDAQQPKSSAHDPQQRRAAASLSPQARTSTGTGNKNNGGEASASSDPDRSPRRSARTVVLDGLGLGLGLGLGHDLDPNAPAAIALAGFLLGSATTLGASAVYRRFFKRIRSAEWITPDLLRRKRWITGIVTRCVPP